MLTLPRVNVPCLGFFHSKQLSAAGACIRLLKSGKNYRRRVSHQWKLNCIANEGLSFYVDWH